MRSRSAWLFVKLLPSGINTPVPTIQYLCDSRVVENGTSSSEEVKGREKGNTGKPKVDKIVHYLRSGKTPPAPAKKSKVERREIRLVATHHHQVPCHS